MRHPFFVRAALLVLVMSAEASLCCGGSALAQGEPPRFWAVTGVAAGDVLNLRDMPHGDSRKLAGIPPDARGLKHLGCLKPEPDLDRWMTMTQAERDNAKLEWCRVEYQGQQGWVAGRFLKPDGR